MNALAIAVKDVSRQENDRHLAQGSLDVWGDILAICNLVLVSYYLFFLLLELLQLFYLHSKMDSPLVVSVSPTT